MLAMLFFPVVSDFSLDTGFSFTAPKFYSICIDFVFPVLKIAIAILALIAIFMYKKRLLQIKICYGIMVLLILTGGLYLLFLMTVCFAPAIAMLFPWIALILDFMAIHRIKKDEKLVRSLDRIR
jgi:hypothetical protein